MNAGPNVAVVDPPPPKIPEPQHLPEQEGRATYGYAQAAEIAGRRSGELGYIIALAITAGADVAVFAQVVSIVMQQLQPWLIWVTVAGFTASSLTLAHFTGRLMRDRAAGYGPVQRWMVWFLAICWALLGLIVFAVRLIVSDSATSVSGTAVSGVSESAAQISSAFMFLILYLASGAVAGVGEFFTRNPYRAQYRKALAYYGKSLKRLTKSQPPYERALSVLQLHTQGRLREEQNYRAAKSGRLANADELKRYSAVLIAAHLKNPSATDGMTLPDRMPLSSPNTPTPHNASDEGKDEGAKK